MQLGEKYKVESDSLNITLYEKGISKTNRKVYWRPIAYFSNLTNAFDHMVDLEVAKTSLKDFGAVVEKQKELHQFIKSLQNTSELLQRVRRQ